MQKCVRHKCQGVQLSCQSIYSPSSFIFFVRCEGPLPQPRVQRRTWLQAWQQFLLQ